MIHRPGRLPLRNDAACLPAHVSEHSTTRRKKAQTPCFRANPSAMRPENARKQRYGGRTFRPVTRWRKVRHHRLAARADKNVPTFSATGRERRFGTQARERPAFRCSGQQANSRPARFSFGQASPPAIPPEREGHAEAHRTTGRVFQGFRRTLRRLSAGQWADTSLPRTARAFMARKQTLSKASGLPQPDHMVRNACSPPFRRIPQPRRLQNPGPCRLRVTRPFPVLPSVSGRLNKKKESWKTMTLQTWSGRLDLNQRLPAPKAGALPLRHAPNKKGCPAEDTGQPYFSKN